MPRRPRRDAPGRKHHVVGHAQGDKPLFRDRRDRRKFKSLLARAVRAGRIRLHAYCLLGTHYHLVVESLDGDLSAAMQWIESRYAEYYRRTRPHRGHVFQGRFFSSPITSLAHLHAVIRYIDQNPVEAGICDDPCAYPYGSARHHVRTGPKPRWLARNAVDAFLRDRRRAGQGREAAYRAVFRARGGRGSEQTLVEGRLSRLSSEPDELDRLLVASREEMEAWVRTGSVRGGRGRRGQPMVDAASVSAAIVRHRSRMPGATLRAARGQSRSLWDVVEAGLLRDLAGLTYEEMVRPLEVGTTQARRRYKAHRQALTDDAAYARAVARVARAALVHCFGRRIRAVLRGE